MPGLFGYTIGQKQSSRLPLLQMHDRLQHHPDYREAFCYESAHVMASSLHAAYSDPANKYACKGNARVWVEGDYYNPETFARQFPAATNLALLLVEAFQADQLHEVLSRIDGYFCAVLYAEDQGKVYLIPDRHGLRPLYFYHRDGQLAWCSEVKGLFSLPWISAEIDETAVSCFLEIGHLLGNMTLHTQIRLVKPATVVAFDRNTGIVQEQLYWSWNKVIQDHSVSFEAAVDRADELFQLAVKKRFSPKEPIGLFLSGGLDSRYILAMLHRLYPDHQGLAVTFGQAGCDDERIAARVAARAGWQHRSYHFREDNWFLPRLPRIALTDGMMNLQHMHGSEFLEDLSRRMKINLNGFLGDVVLRGSYLPEDRAAWDQRVDRHWAEQFYGRFAAHTDLDSPYFDIDHLDAYVLANRGRRFVAMGLTNFQTRIDQRLPFFDNELLEFMYGLPDAYRYQNRFYRSLLLRHHGSFFKDIPWQNTGLPIGQRDGVGYRLARKIRRLPAKLGWQSRAYHYADYCRWIQNGNTATHLQTALSDTASPILAYCNRTQLEQLLMSNRNSKADQSEKILRYFTLDHYLRQLENCAA